MFQLSSLAFMSVCRGAAASQNPSANGVGSTDQDGLVVPLQMDGNRQFHFPSPANPDHSSTLLDLKGLEKIAKEKNLAVEVDVPQDSATAGSLALQQPPKSDKILWIASPNPGEKLPSHSARLEQGDAREVIGQEVSLASYVTNFAPETPYTTIPNKIYEDSSVAVNAEKIHTGVGNGYEDVVDCGRLSEFPDLVLVFADGGSVSISPEQYVEKIDRGRFQGKCLLLVQREGDTDDNLVVSGWNVMRGRKIIFQWDVEGTGRTGFGQ